MIWTALKETKQRPSYIRVFKFPQPTPKTYEVMQAVCVTFGTDVQKLLGRRKWKHLAFVRQVVMYVLREHDMTLGEIGAQFGRDHSTVVHAIAKVRSRMLDDPYTAEKIYGILDHLGLYRHRGICLQFAGSRPGGGSRYGDYLPADQKASDLCRRPGCGRRRGVHLTPETYEALRREHHATIVGTATQP